MTPRHFRHEALTARRSPVAARHICLCAGFIEEDEAFGVQLALSRKPGSALLGNVFAVLLGSML
jgi:hypothetical protein